MTGFVGKIHLELCELEVDDARELLIKHLDSKRDVYTLAHAIRLHNFIINNAPMNKVINDRRKQ